MNVYAMKTEMTVCDNCKKSIAVTKCDICGGDLCGSLRCQIKDEIRSKIAKDNSSPMSLICKLTYCSKCKKTSKWSGELSDDMKDIICLKINARKMLETVEKNNGKENG